MVHCGTPGIGEGAGVEEKQKRIEENEPGRKRRELR
jgi:hypothetical protein